MPLDLDSSLAYETVVRGDPQGILLLLHGVGGNETNLAGLAEQVDPRVACVLPRAPLAYAADHFGWFDVTFRPWGPVIDPDQAEASRARLAALVERLQERWGVGRKRTVIAGFSQGGIMSAGVGLSRPDLVCGFGLLSGRILPELEPRIAPAEALAGLSAFVSHGIEDPTLSCAWADRSDAWLTKLGVPVESRRYPAGHELTAEMARDFLAWATVRLLPS
ncbi:MAG: phospholipase [Holophaga sp.]|jgi:phospholipase/carboxylesterase